VAPQPDDILLVHVDPVPAARIEAVRALQAVHEVPLHEDRFVDMGNDGNPPATSVGATERMNHGRQRIMATVPSYEIAPRAERWADGTLGQAVMLAGAATVLGLALQCHDGRIEPGGFVLMAVAFACAFASVAAPPSHRVVAWSMGQFELLLGAAVVLTLAFHFVRPPGIYLERVDGLARLPFLAGVACVAAIVLAVVRARAPLSARARWAALLGLLGLYLVLGDWVIRHAPHPAIDVAFFQRDGVAVLLDGRNPYTLTFPDIYRGTSAYYGEGMSVGGRLQFGFVYPPLSLLLAVPGAVLGGDFRYSQLVAMAFAGALIARARGERVGLLAAALLLFSPRGFFVIEQGWTEPFSIALLAGVVFCVCRRRRALLGVAFGLLMVSKQYLVLALPLLLRLAPSRTVNPSAATRGWFAMVLGVGGVAASVVTLPLALWNFRAFVHDVVALQFSQPFRDDALSFPAALAYVTGWRMPNATAFAAAAVAGVVSLRRCARTPSGFAAAVALVFFSFFAFNKQAFCNYYTFVLGALCAAIGAWGSEPPATGRLRAEDSQRGMPTDARPFARPCGAPTVR
jgi:hypothetical protein